MDDLSIENNHEDLEVEIDLEALAPYVPDEQRDDLNERGELEIFPVTYTVSFSVKAYTVSHELFDIRSPSSVTNNSARTNLRFMGQLKFVFSKQGLLAHQRGMECQYLGV